MRYFKQMMPNVALATRAVRELGLGTLYYHAANNLRHNLFQPTQSVDGEILPNSIYIEPTMACSRRCEGCYPQNLGEPSKIPESIAHHVFDTAEELGLNYVAWIGGEPLIPHVGDLTLRVSAEHKNVAVVLCTNGDYLDRKIADRIGETKNVVTFISIDGHQESHDKRRGKNSYNNVISAMGNLHATGVMFGYSTILTSENYGEVTSDSFIDEMVHRGNFVGGYHLFLSNGWHRLQPSAEQFAEAISVLNQHARTKPLYILSTEYGRLNGGHLMKGKRLISLTIDPWGGVRTERGGNPVDFIGDGRSLSDIVKSEEVQQIFASKMDGSEDAPDDGNRMSLIDRAYRILIGRE